MVSLQVLFITSTTRGIFQIAEAGAIADSFEHFCWKCKKGTMFVARFIHVWFFQSLCLNIAICWPHAYPDFTSMLYEHENVTSKCKKRAL